MCGVVKQTGFDLGSECHSLLLLSFGCVVGCKRYFFLTAVSSTHVKLRNFVVTSILFIHDLLLCFHGVLSVEMRGGKCS